MLLRPQSGSLCYVEFFHGSNPLPTEPYRTIRPDSNIGFIYIRDIQNIGDVNGDGNTDYWIYGSPPNHQLSRYWIYYGGPDDDGVPDTVLSPGTSQSLFRGYLPIGDFNGDGYADIGSCIYGFGQGTDLYWGGQSDTISDWHRSTSLITMNGGDINGDGYGDIITPTASSVGNLYLGSANPDTLPDFNSEENPVFEWSIGNFIGPAYDDLGGWGPDGPAIQAGGPNFDTDIDLTFDFLCEFFVKFGDVNADGFDDIGIYCDNGQLGLFLGGWQPSTHPVAVLTMGFPIIGVTGLGDINGDGVGDFAIGGHTDIEWEGLRGRAVIFSGDSSYHVPADNSQHLQPTMISLSCYPNPFNSNATISFTLPHTGEVKMTVYDVLGRETERTWHAMSLQAGIHQIPFDGTRLSSGIYFVRLEAEGMAITRKIVLLK